MPDTTENAWKDRYLLETLEELREEQKAMRQDVSDIRGRLIAIEVKGGIISTVISAVVAWFGVQLKN